MDSPTPQVPTSFWYHLMTLGVLLVAFYVGSCCMYRYQYVEALGPSMPTEQARTQIVVALAGLLGAAAQLSIAWAKDVNAQLTGTSKQYPCVLEPIGYMLKIIWGSLTAVMANCAAQTGALITVTSTGGGAQGTSASLKPEASMLLGFCVGLTAFRMLTWLSGLFRPKPNNGGVPSTAGSAPHPASATPTGASTAGASPPPHRP